MYRFSLKHSPSFKKGGGGVATLPLDSEESKANDLGEAELMANPKTSPSFCLMWQDPHTKCGQPTRAPRPNCKIAS